MHLRFGGVICPPGLWRFNPAHSQHPDYYTCLDSQMCVLLFYTLSLLEFIFRLTRNRTGGCGPECVIERKFCSTES
eukprot:4179450-Amphidinium_carterae.1